MHCQRKRSFRIVRFHTLRVNAKRKVLFVQCSRNRLSSFVFGLAHVASSPPPPPQLTLKPLNIALLFLYRFHFMSYYSKFSSLQYVRTTNVHRTQVTTKANVHARTCMVLHSTYSAQRTPITHIYNLTLSQSLSARLLIRLYILSFAFSVVWPQWHCVRFISRARARTAFRKRFSWSLFFASRGHSVTAFDDYGRTMNRSSHSHRHTHTQRP